MTKRVYLGKTLIMIERIKAHRKKARFFSLILFAKYYLYTIKLALSKLSMDEFNFFGLNFVTVTCVV